MTTPHVNAGAWLPIESAPRDKKILAALKEMDNG